MVNSETLSISGAGRASRGELGFPISFDFDRRDILKNGRYAADQVELAKVPVMGAVFGNYPDRSTPTVIGGKSR